jgi:predicted membrane channel-forming protein YqfA (hemolysin III family)
MWLVIKIFVFFFLVMWLVTYGIGMITYIWSIPEEELERERERMAERKKRSDFFKAWIGQQKKLTD